MKRIGHGEEKRVQSDDCRKSYAIMDENEQPDKAFIAHEAKKELWASESEPYIERLPSNVTDIPWIYIKRKEGEYPATTPKSGKWLIPLREAKLDEIWPAVKQATEEGKLGQSSMAATAMPKSRATKSGEKMMCVFTYDYTEAEDARRVRQALRDLGITKKLRYKADEDTQAGRYGFGYKYYE
jgi:hypothetical protein